MTCPSWRLLRRGSFVFGLLMGPVDGTAMGKFNIRRIFVQSKAILLRGMIELMILTFFCRVRCQLLTIFTRGSPKPVETKEKCCGF